MEAELGYSLTAFSASLSEPRTLVLSSLRLTDKGPLKKARASGALPVDTCITIFVKHCLIYPEIAAVVEVVRVSRKQHLIQVFGFQ